MPYWDARRKQNFGHLVNVNKVKQLKYWKISANGPLSFKFYDGWLKQNPNTENEDKIQFSNQ